MTRARRAAAIVLCAGLAVGLAGQLSGDLGLPGALRSLSQNAGDGTGTAGARSRSQAASSVPGLEAATARLNAAQLLLATRAAAVRDHRKKSWMATLDARRSPFRGRQSLAFDNLRKLPLGQFSYGEVRLAPVLSAARARQAGPGAWAAAVTGTYSLAGFDRAPQSFEETYTFVKRAGGWRIADDISRIQMWDLPGMRVLHSRSVIVIGNAPEARMRSYRSAAESGVRRVNGVWGTQWASHVVIVTPSTDQEFAELLARSSRKGLDQVAAITQGVVELGHRAQGDRVVINPRAFTGLQPLGRRVVITHELTHVAVRSSTTGPVPIWLTEGMADYVGYSGLGLSRERVAADLLTRVRRGKGPKVLPRPVDFDPSRTKIATSYSGSWLAVSRLVDLYGQAAVVRFYRVLASVTTAVGAVHPDPDVAAAAAFPRSFGLSQERFVVGWRRYLRALAQG